jgi:hypothetical protein
MAKWIVFKELPKGKNRLTRLFVVLNTESQTPIGNIAWYGAFRQYSFFPKENTVFEKTCLKDISEFLQQLMDERKHEKQPRSPVMIIDELKIK